jgi:tripartite-type tricarboxylate transporter receptor subunit TctC
MSKDQNLMKSITKNCGLTGLLIAALFALAGVASPAFAQKTFPLRPITLIVPGAGGSSTDNIARQYADRLSQQLGQPVVIDLRPGGNGAVGARALAAAKPDGYTLMMPGNSIIVLTPLTMKNPTYDADKDFVPVAQVVAIPFGVAVGSSQPIRSIQELMAMAKEKELFFASPNGSASIPRLIGEWLKQKGATGLSFVGYPSAPPAHLDVIGGRVHVMIDGMGGAAPHVKSGKMRLLAVTTQDRVKAFPDVPALAETIPGFVVPGFFAVVAPAGTPNDVVELLNRESRVVAQDPKLNERFEIFGAVAASGSRADLERLIRDQRVLFKGLLEQAKINPE